MISQNDQTWPFPLVAWFILPGTPLAMKLVDSIFQCKNVFVAYPMCQPMCWITVSLKLTNIHGLGFSYRILLGGDWNHGILWLSIQLGISSSQLTNSIIFQRGWLKPPTRICGGLPNFGSPKILCFLQAPHHEDETALPRFPCRVLEEDVCAGRDPAVVGWGYPAEYHEDMMGIQKTIIYAWPTETNWWQRMGLWSSLFFRNTNFNTSFWTANKMAKTCFPDQAKE